jgi:ADP-ribosyl-[dinitrogen reductase] hydrolase
MKTSQSHPLQIATVPLKSGAGAIGIAFCPGKKQAFGMSGAWDRDLDIDLDAIRDWGASAVVTLVEDHELEALKVTRMGEAVRSRHMAWFHLPIRDVDIPGAAFEAAWAEAGAGLRARLRDGSRVFIHCKGGIGRAGTIAARLLIEMGEDPASAIVRVRQHRKGAIETDEQEAYVRRVVETPEPSPDTSAAAIQDRALGALLGLAAGDAVGTTVEFKARGSFPLVTDMTGGGPFRLQPGEWTDDTALALALADSLALNPALDEVDLMTRFVDWQERGTYSCTGECFDIGITTSSALRRWKMTGDPVAGDTNPQSAGNGSLMRLSPVAVRHWRERPTLRDVAARQSRTTHAAPEAVEACVAYAAMLADAIEGRPRSEVLSDRPGTFPGKVGRVVAGAWRRKSRAEIRGSGYVVDALEASLWSVGRTGSFEEAILAAVNLGDDADTTGAITGQLAGALYGASAIPEGWRQKLAWRERLEASAKSLFLAGSGG